MRPPSVPLRIAFVPGVTPSKWVRIWEQRMPGSPIKPLLVGEHDQVSVLDDGLADMSFVRLPVDREGLSLIPLYREVPVVVVPVEHPVAAFDEISVTDLSDEHLLQPDSSVPPASPKEAIEAVAMGSGIVIVPKSVARLHNRKEVTSRPVTGVAESQIGLAWLADNSDPRNDTFIGIVRGRTERSSRDGAEPARKPTRQTRRQ